MNSTALSRLASLLMLVMALALVAAVWGRTEPTSAREPGPTPPSAPAVSNADLEYFSEIAFGTEFGAATTVAHKWDRDIRITVNGEASPEDLQALEGVIAELNGLVTGISLAFSDQSPNLEVHFAPESTFSSLEPNYVAINYGFSWVWWDGNGSIYRGRMLIASQGITQAEREHLIREELTQSLGLFRDSWKYEDSIFYQGWTDINEYSPRDISVIQSLYRPAVTSGMSRAEALDALGAAD